MTPNGEGVRALALRGTCAVVDGQQAPTTDPTNPPPHVRVTDAIADRARERMRSGTRVVLRFVPDGAHYVGGWATESDDGDG